MINVSHPGRYGDLFWALPTVRMLHRQHGAVRLHLPVDPANTTPMKAVVNLLQKQDYLAEIVIREDWSIELEAPRRPFAPPEGGYNGAWVHLAYQEWPLTPLPFYSACLGGFLPEQVDFKPWIHAEPAFERAADETVVLFHWTDRWFELKAGLTHIITQGPRALPLTAWTLRTDPNSQRWDAYRHAVGTTFENLARQIAACSLVVTDCSSAHVLAAAMGKRCVVVEPEEARHHKVFWPGSIQDAKGHWHQAPNRFGELVYPVIGSDGKPTFDARHTADLIKELLK